MHRPGAALGQRLSGVEALPGPQTEHLQGVAAQVKTQTGIAKRLQAGVPALTRAKIRTCVDSLNVIEGHPVSVATTRAKKMPEIDRQQQSVQTPVTHSGERLFRELPRQPRAHLTKLAAGRSEARRPWSFKLHDPVEIRRRTRTPPSWLRGRSLAQHLSEDFVQCVRIHRFVQHVGKLAAGQPCALFRPHVATHQNQGRGIWTGRSTPRPNAAQSIMPRSARCGSSQRRARSPSRPHVQPPAFRKRQPPARARPASRPKGRSRATSLAWPAPIPTQQTRDQSKTISARCSCACAIQLARAASVGKNSARSSSCSSHCAPSRSKARRTGKPRTSSP